MRKRQSSIAVAPIVRVRISPAIERNYIQRKAFPDLRIACAKEVENGSGFFEISQALAVAVLADARAQYALPWEPETRGRKKAFGALIQQLEPKPAPAAAVPAAKRLTLDDIANRHVSPTGLIVENYQPRLMRYTGSSRQISLAAVLPLSFPGWPKAEGSGWPSERWEAGDLHYSLSKKHVSGDAQRREDFSADFWTFDVCDNRYRFEDYIDRLSAKN